jgi:hypothetical protein
MVFRSLRDGWTVGDASTQAYVRSEGQLGVDVAGVGAAALNYMLLGSLRDGWTVGVASTQASVRSKGQLGVDGELRVISLQLLRLPASRAADGMLLSMRACVEGICGCSSWVKRGAGVSDCLRTLRLVYVCSSCSGTTLTLHMSADCQLVGLSHILKMVLAPAAVLLLLLPPAAVSLIAPCSVTMTAVRRLRA